MARAEDAQPLAVAFATARRHRHLELAAQVLRGERVRALEHLVQRALSHHHATVHAGAGAEVDQPVGAADGLLVVLDHQHRVAEIAHAFERRQQARVVALMQTDRRLVEHVEHALELAADLGGEPDALALAAREARRRAIEREIAHADVVEEAEAVADLLQHLVGDLALLVAELERRHHAAQVGDRHRGELVDGAVGDLDRQRLAPQSAPAAAGARLDRHVLLDLGAHARRLGVAVAPLEHRHHAFVRALPGVGRALAADLELELLAGEPVEHRVARGLG